MEFDSITYLGFFAATLTTGAFFPQALKTWRTKSAKDLSASMFIMMTLGMVMWLTYGILRNDMPIIIANLVALIFAGVILFVKIRELMSTGSQP